MENEAELMERVGCWWTPFLSFGPCRRIAFENLFVRGSSHAICAISATRRRSETNSICIQLCTYFVRPEIWANFGLRIKWVTSHATTRSKRSFEVRNATKHCRLFCAFPDMPWNPPPSRLTNAYLFCWISHLENTWWSQNYQNLTVNKTGSGPTYIVWILP